MTKTKSPVRHTAQLARKRERRRRRLTMLVFVVFACGAAAYGGYEYWLRDSSLVEIKDLKVKGVTADTEEERQIRDAIEVAAGEMTTLHLKPELLERELARFPRVRSATIDAGFPNAATVTVDQRSDGSVLEAGSDALLIATDGTVLGTAGEGTDELPRIGSGDPVSGGRLEGRILNEALVLGAVPDALRPFVGQSGSSQDGVEVTMSNGLVLVFGDATKADQKWRAAASVIADPNLTDASYVDLSVPRRPAVRGTEGSESATPVVPEATGTAPPEG